MSEIKDIGLSGKGKAELFWARENMPVLSQIRERFKKEKPLQGITVGVALHLEKKTAILLETLAQGGAKVYAASCNPNTTDDSVAAALAEDGNNIEVFAKSNETKEEYYRFIDSVLDSKPQIVVDDGCDLMMRLHQKRPGQIKEVYGGCEETTTGIVRLKAMQKQGALKLPVFSVNDAFSKFLLDNQFGTAQSTLDAIAKCTNKLIAGKTAVVFGYGWCGRGIASRLKGMGANVIVVEVEGTLGPHESGQNRALTALYDGYRVLDHKSAAKEGHIFITATGNKNVLREEHFKLMRDGAILANSGHFDVEISKPGLRALSEKVEKIKDNLECYHLKGGKRIYLLSEGRLVNLDRPSGQGHPIEIMDGSFAIQALCVELLAKDKGKTLAPGVHNVPKEIDDYVASAILNSQGITLDKPTEEQIKYADEWQEGT